MNLLILILVVLLLLYVVFILIVRKLAKEWSLTDRRFFDENWQRILDLHDYKHGILEADKLLDEMLRKRGYQGSLGEKLKKSAKQFSDLNALWTAHKVRNKLAHELGYQLKEKEYRAAMSGFRKAFHDLNLL